MMHKKIKVGSLFEELVKEKYKEMLEKGISVDSLYSKEYPMVQVFIDRKPKKFFLAVFHFDIHHKVYVGSDI